MPSTVFDPVAFQAWQEIEDALGRFERSDGFQTPCQLLIGSARRDT